MLAANIAHIALFKIIGQQYSQIHEEIHEEMQDINENSVLPYDHWSLNEWDRERPK